MDEIEQKLKKILCQWIILCEERNNDFPFLIIKNLFGCNKKNLNNRELFGVIIKISLTD